MKLIWKAILVFTILIFFTACSDKDEETTKDPQHNPNEPNKTEENTTDEQEAIDDEVKQEENDIPEQPDSDAKDTNDDRKPEIRDMVIYQAQAGSKNYVGLSNRKEQILDKYPLHLDEIVILFSAITPNEDEFLSQITLAGQGELEITELERNYYEYKITIKNIEGSSRLQLGDKSITFEKMEPLEWTIEKSEINDPALLITPDSFFEGIPSTLFLSNNEKGKALLTFNEKMDTSTDVQNIKGEWINDHQYSIELEWLLNHDSIFLTELRSERGNTTISGANSHLEFVRQPLKTWISFSSNERVGWSELDTYYDFLLFSPDKESYIGVINHGIGPGSGDGDGAYYSFVLERKDESPLNIEEGYFTSVRQEGIPIQWMDNERLMYSNSAKVMVYDINTGEKSVLFSSEEREHDFITQAAYDSFNNRTYILTGHYEPENDRVIVDKWVFEGSKQIDYIPDYSPTMDEYKYTINDLSIHPEEHGVFWTYMKGNHYFTHYEGRNGETKDVEGEVILINGDTIYLEVKEFGFEAAPPQYFIWKFDQNPIKLPVPPVDYVEPFGKLLVTKDWESGDYYYFEEALNEWKEMQLENKHLEIPLNQEAFSIYQVEE